MKNELFEEINRAVKPEKELTEAVKRAMAGAAAAKPNAPRVIKKILPAAAAFAVLAVGAGVALNRLPAKIAPDITPELPAGEITAAEAPDRTPTGEPSHSAPVGPEEPNAAPDTQALPSAPSSDPPGKEDPPQTAAPTEREPPQTTQPEELPRETAPSPFGGETAPDPNGSYRSNVTPLILTDRYYYPSLEAMAADENVVAVAGTVLSSEPFRFGTHPDSVFTRAVVRVERCLKGDFTPGQTLTVIEPGGGMEGHIWTYNVYRTSEPGDKVVMFLCALPADFSAEALGGEAAYSPAGATQGTFLYEEDLTGSGGYRCSGHYHAIELDPKANTPFRMEDFVSAVEKAR